MIYFIIFWKTRSLSVRPTRKKNVYIGLNVCEINFFLVSPLYSRYQLPSASRLLSHVKYTNTFLLPLQHRLYVIYFFTKWLSGRSLSSFSHPFPCSILLFQKSYSLPYPTSIFILYVDLTKSIVVRKSVLLCIFMVIKKFNSSFYLLFLQIAVWRQLKNK